MRIKLLDHFDAVVAPLYRLFEWVEDLIDPKLAAERQVAEVKPPLSIAERADAIFPDPEAKGKLFDVVL